MCGRPTKHVDHNKGGDLPNTQEVALIPCIQSIQKVQELRSIKDSSDSSPNAPKNFNTQTFKYKEDLKNTWRIQRKRRTPKQAYCLEIRLQVCHQLSLFWETYFLRPSNWNHFWGEESREIIYFILFYFYKEYKKDCIPLFQIRTEFGYKPVCSQLIIIHYTTAHKVIHMYYLNKSHN